MKSPHPRVPRGKPARPTGGAFRGRRPVRRELSAGGVVVRQNDSHWLVALLKTEHKRGQVWVLPKGHVELASRERIADAAQREVQEEAGLSDVAVKNQLGVTRFTFQAEGTMVAKTVHYFLMITSQEQLTPQKEEGLLEAAWFPIDEAIENLAYDTDQEIVRRAKEYLVGPAPRARRRSRIHV